MIAEQMGKFNSIQSGLVPVILRQILAKSPVLRQMLPADYLE